MPPEVDFSFDGTPYRASEGRSIAAALMSNGVASWRLTRVEDRPRGIMCGIGVCFDCLVVLNGSPNTRACVTRVEAGDDIRTQHGTGHAG